MKTEHRLTAYKESLKAAWQYNDYNDWPIKFNSIMHLFMEEFTKEFLEDFEKLKSSEKRAVAKEFKNPDRVYRSIHSLIYGMKKMKYSISRQREIVLELLELVGIMKKGSVFNEDGSNIIYDQDKIRKIYEDKCFRLVSKNDSILIQKFCGILWAYTEAIYFRAHDIPKLIHGSYKLDGTFNNLFIRDYMNLNTADFWYGIEFLPVNEICIYTEYKDNLKVDIDSYNHVSMKSGNYIEDLEYCYIEADGKEIGLDEILKYIPIIENAIRSINKWVEKSDWREITKRYADIYWYRKKPLRDLLNIEWKVPDKVREEIDNGQMNEKRIRNLTNTEIDRLIYTII
jgi:hypothetical protein